MIPRIIHQIWIGPDLPADQSKFIRGVGSMNPEWSHIVWGATMLKGVGIDAYLLKDELKTWASVSNYVRLRLLLKFGGCYLDTDMEALRPLDTIGDFDCFAAEQDHDRICNAFMGAAPSHPWIAWQLQHWSDFNQKDAAGGVYLATAAPRNLVRLIPQHLVYPWMYDSQPEKRVAHPESILIHHWAGSWNK